MDASVYPHAADVARTGRWSDPTSASTALVDDADLGTHEDVVDLAVRHDSPATCARGRHARQPGRNVRTPGPQKLQSPATTAGRPGFGSCAASRRSWIGGP